MLQVRREISADGASLAIRFATAASEVQETCGASAERPVTQLESSLISTQSSLLQETDITQRLRLHRVRGWRAGYRLQELGVALVMEFTRTGRRTQKLLLKRPLNTNLSGDEPSTAAKLELSALLGGLQPAVTYDSYRSALSALPMQDKGADLIGIIEKLESMALSQDGISQELVSSVRALHISMPTTLRLPVPPGDKAAAKDLRRVHAYAWALAQLTSKEEAVKSAGASTLMQGASLTPPPNVGDKRHAEPATILCATHTDPRQSVSPVGQASTSPPLSPAAAGAAAFAQLQSMNPSALLDVLQAAGCLPPANSLSADTSAAGASSHPAASVGRSPQPVHLVVGGQTQALSDDDESGDSSSDDDDSEESQSSSPEDEDEEEVVVHHHAKSSGKRKSQQRSSHQRSPLAHVTRQ